MTKKAKKKKRQEKTYGNYAAAAGYESSRKTMSKAIGKLSDAEGDMRRRALRKSIKAAENVGDLQTARSLSYQLAKENLLNLHKVAGSQADAILRASAPAIRNAHRPATQWGRTQRDTLERVFTGDYERERIEDETMLESQRRVIEAERELKKARTPEAREAAAYRLTRAKLIDGHRRGEI